MTLAFGLVVGAALVRGVFGTAAVAGVSGATLAATLWVLAFGLVVARIGPWLALPKVAPRQPSRGS